MGASSKASRVPGRRRASRLLQSAWESRDVRVKNREYASTASVQRYVMLEQGTAGATMFERAGADWLGRILSADAVIRMPEVGIEIPLAELYEGLDLSGLPRDEDGEPA